MKKARNQISKSQRKDTILQICKLAQLQIWANIRNRIKTSFVPYKISSCWLRIAIAAAATFIHTCAHNCTQETENTKMSDAAHRLLDNLVNDLKTKLLAKTHEDIVVELEKRERALQIMVEEMLAEHKAHMLEVFLDKVKDEVQMFAVATNDAMDSFIGEMKCQLNTHIKRVVEKEVALQLQAKMQEKEQEEMNKEDDEKVTSDQAR